MYSVVALGGRMWRRSSAPFAERPTVNYGLYRREGADVPSLFEALAAKLNMVSIVRTESSELSAAIVILGRFPPPENGAIEDNEAPNSLTKSSDTPALSEKSNGKSRRCLMLLPSRFLAGNPHTSGAKPMR